MQRLPVMPAVELLCGRVVDETLQFFEWLTRATWFHVKLRSLMVKFGRTL